MTQQLWTLTPGDSREILRRIPDGTFHSIVTDPPYELGFMGKAWDRTGIAYDATLWAECLRVLRPGGHLLCFGGTRTHHRVWCAIEDAGFQIRDTLSWLYGSGFPKSLDIAKAIADPALAAPWTGHGTALKPGWEPILLAKKPHPGQTIAACVLEHGTGSLNVDGCRVEAEVTTGWGGNASVGYGGYGEEKGGRPVDGRWPANLLHDGSAAITRQFPEDAGGSGWSKSEGAHTYETYGKFAARSEVHHADTGSAARFFPAFALTEPDRLRALEDARFLYCAKPTASERDAGLDEVEEGVVARSCGSFNQARIRRNIHPTVKPIALMRWLVRLVTPAGGHVLDPFTGSGPTGIAAITEGFTFHGIELNPDYHPIIEARLRHATALHLAERAQCLFTAASARHPDNTPKDHQPLLFAS